MCMFNFLFAITNFAAPLGRIQSNVQFDLSKSTQILASSQDGVVAKKIRDQVNMGQAEFAFVAEDGSAAAVWTGTVSKVDVKTGATLTENDKFKVELKGGKMTAFNVSQEPYVRHNLRGAIDVSLKPLIFLDMFRTLCVNGPQSAPEATDPRIPKSSIFLAVIDDRERGPHPNLVKAISLPKGGILGTISAIGYQSGSYILSIRVGGKVQYLAVNPKPLSSKWVSKPRWTGFADDLNSLKRSDLVSRAAARWHSNSYFLMISNSDPKGTGFVWDGKSLSKIDPYYMVSASFNGRFGWVADRSNHSQWIIGN